MIETGEMESPPEAWHTIIGLQFENLVVNNRKILHRLLGIKANEIVMGNPYFQTSTNKHEKCQIDYLIQTKFNTLYLCEIRFSKHEINAKVIDEVEGKVKKLLIPKRFSIRTVLVHVNGVTDKVIAREYFSHIIDFGDFLNAL